jgi:hypothetical protein
LCQVSISFITATNHIALNFAFYDIIHSLYQISASNRSSRAYILCTGF